MSAVVYSLDQIPFKNYNVSVSDSSNLFDKPSFKEGLSKSWDNEHGYDIDLKNRYKESKIITLDCFISATSKIECITQYNNFLNEIDKKGSRRLSVLADTLRLEFQVFRVDSVEVNLTYDDTNKVGIFKLKLVENMPVKRVLEFSNLNLVSTYQTFYNEYFDLLNRSNISGRNLTKDSEQFNLNIYNGTTRIRTVNFEVPEWGTSSAVRYQTSGGTDFMKVYNPLLTTLSSNIANKDKTYSVSFYAKNLGNKTIRFNTNAIGDVFLLAGEQKLIKIEGKNGNDSSHLQIQARALEIEDSLDFAIWRVKTEYGNKCTDWTPAPEDIRDNSITSLTTISSDNIINPSEKQTFKIHYDNTKKLYNELLFVNNPTSNLISYYSNLTQLSDYILRDLNVNTSVNTSATTITINSPKVLVINWGDGTEQYTSLGNNTYNKTYTTQKMYYPLILGDIDSITLFNANSTIVWNKF